MWLSMYTAYIVTVPSISATATVCQVDSTPSEITLSGYGTSASSLVASAYDVLKEVDTLLKEQTRLEKRLRAALARATYGGWLKPLPAIPPRRHMYRGRWSYQ